MKTAPVPAMEQPSPLSLPPWRPLSMPSAMGSFNCPSWSLISSRGLFFVLIAALRLCLKRAWGVGRRLFGGPPVSHSSHPAERRSGCGLWHFGSHQNQTSSLTFASGPYHVEARIVNWVSRYQFKPGITDTLFISLCAHPGLPLFPLNGGIFDVIKKK